MKRIAGLLVSGLVLLLAPRLASASAESSLAAAAAAGHPVFLIVTDATASSLDAARRVVSEAQRLVPDATVLEMDRADAANAEVVRRYRLASVPVPLVLVVAPNGVAAGGARPEAVTAERLAAMVPSPAKASFLKALDEKKAVFLVFGRASMPDLAAATKRAAEAVATMRGAAAVVQVDLDAPAEAPFVAEMKQDPKAKYPVVAVYNARGQATETLVGAPTASDLVAAATKAPAGSPCCPGGSCGPNGGK